MHKKILLNISENMKNEIFTLCCILLAVSSAQTDWEGVSRNVAISSVEKQPHDSESISFLLRQPEKDVTHIPSSTTGAFNATTERTKPANTPIANTKTANNNDSSLLPKIRKSRGIHTAVLNSFIGISSANLSGNSIVSSDSNSTIEKIIDSLLPSANETSKSTFGDSITKFLSEINSGNFTALTETSTTIGNLTVSLISLGNETLGIFANAGKDFIKDANTTTDKKTTTTNDDDDDKSILSIISTSIGKEALKKIENAVEDLIKEVVSALPAGNKTESSSPTTTSPTTIKPSSIAPGCANDSCETKLLLYVFSKLGKRLHQYLTGPPIEN